MADMTCIGTCPICKCSIVEDEVSEACDYRGRSTGDYAEDIFDGTPQSHVGHPRCVVMVDPRPEQFNREARAWARRYEELCARRGY